MLSGTELDDQLWWIMLGAGMGAVVVSLGTSYIGYAQAGLISERRRFLLHMLSYILLTVSVLAFVVRGFISTQ